MIRTALRGSYLHFLRAMHQYARPRTYVEIGVAFGDSLTLATRSKRVVGIDPAPKTNRPLPRHSTVYEETSDDFFAGHDLSEMIGTVDVAFIDGLHLFEQTLLDFANLERHMSPNGVILVHDCYPPGPEWATRSRRPGAWAGDVWKLLPILADYRPDLNVNVVAVNPTGMGIVTNLDPSSSTLRDDHADIISKYLPIGYEPWNGALAGRWSAAEHLFPVFRGRGPLEQTLLPVRRVARGLKRRVVVVKSRKPS